MHKLLAAVLLTVGIGGLAVQNWPGGVDFPDWPAPAPAPAPTPGPSPSPTPGSPLAQLVPDRAQRAALITFFGDMATLVERDTAGRIKSTEQLREAQNAASDLMVKSGTVVANPAFRAALMQRQQEALGLEPVAIDHAMRAKAVAFYRGLAAELAQ